MKLNITGVEEFRYFENPRKLEYLNYLMEHVRNVNRAWTLQLKPALVSMREDMYAIQEAERNILNHDLSKYDDEEFIPYLNHFYPCEDEGFPNDEKQFDVAWLRHIHNNPHHWQHWVLLRDSGETVALDIPKVHVWEMLCDWASFSAKDPESTAPTWYADNKNKMRLSNNSKKLIDKYIKILECPLFDI